MTDLQRKYTDLIRQVSGKRVNWDPLVPVEVRRVALVPEYFIRFRPYPSLI